MAKHKKKVNEWKRPSPNGKKTPHKCLLRRNVRYLSSSPYGYIYVYIVANIFPWDFRLNRISFLPVCREPTGCVCKGSERIRWQNRTPGYFKRWAALLFTDFGMVRRFESCTKHQQTTMALLHRPESTGGHPFGINKFKPIKTSRVVHRVTKWESFYKRQFRGNLCKTCNAITQLSEPISTKAQNQSPRAFWWISRVSSPRVVCGGCTARSAGIDLHETSRWWVSNRFLQSSARWWWHTGNLKVRKFCPYCMLFAVAIDA